MKKQLADAESAVQEAIAWMVLLRSGDATDQDVEAFESWRTVPHHDAICRQIESSTGLLQPLVGAGQADAAHRSLLTPVSRRHLLSWAVAGAGTAALGGWVGRETQLWADARTGTGERRTMKLADGSTLVLNARSAVDVLWGDNQRLITLRRGQVLATVARDPANRPFIIRTAHGSVTALGTRFLVGLQQGQTQVDVLESVVEARASSGRALRVAAGAAASFTPDAVRSEHRTPEAQAAWASGLLEANDASLAEVIDALRPYRSGILQLGEAAGRLRLSGIFRLDDTDRTLDSLAQTLPLRIERRTRYWVVIDLAPVA